VPPGGPTVAVSPIIGGAAVSGPAGELLRACGLPVSPVGIARAYAPWLQTLLIDAADTHLTPELEVHGVTAVIANIMMSDATAETALAGTLLTAASRSARDDATPDLSQPTDAPTPDDATSHRSQPTHAPTRPPRPRYK
jgi:2-phospho-L-lactate transferase/gluconeogenesis factor (CofD/UPF0052 family)